MSTLGEEFLEFFSSSCIEAVDRRGIASPSGAETPKLAAEREGSAVGFPCLTSPPLNIPSKRTKGAPWMHPLIEPPYR
jgi:hypothetical protein